MDLIEKLVEGLFWLLIAASPALIGAIIGGIFYIKFNGNLTSIILFTMFVIMGAIVGGFWAEKVRKKHGTSKFYSKVIATPELDKEENN
ncbi:MAG: hypothetical protein ABIA04_04890 [Pseudomonadota bacterium]